MAFFRGPLKPKTIDPCRNSTWRVKFEQVEVGQLMETIDGWEIGHQQQEFAV